MGNYLSNTNNDNELSKFNSNTYIPYKLNNTSIDPLYLTKLRYWERDIRWKRWNSTSNIPLSYRLI